FRHFHSFPTRRSSDLYMLDIPTVVSVIGMLHGVLFSLYLIMILIMTTIVRIHIKWPIVALISAFIPFGTFIFDRFFINSKTYDRSEEHTSELQSRFDL